ncbi:hypothetical protein ACFLIM_38950 [Nonomuraea sp. M3C6]|uniref:Uncharacterized protein n=1 Tax=Nonomuraea marmarensis TaxID=3351344 RepID=A0ABW7AP54_9ACTN
MKIQFGLIAWFVLTVALGALSYAWPPAAYVLAFVGAVSVAFTMAFVAEGALHELRSVIQARQYQRSLDQARAAFLARRASFEREEATDE